MATVHYGRLASPTGFGRIVAIKRVRSDLADDREARDMLADEARMAARVRHPNVVQILDVLVSDEELMLVMDYVAGDSLAQVLARAKERGEVVPPPVAAAIVCDVLQGLHAAHEARDANGQPLELVHRDLSPNNVLVDEHGIARVLDFGVAKARGRAHTTEPGGLRGTLAYMAPEQVHGETSRRSDIFSVGIWLWEMLTGARLFEGKTRGETLAAVLATRVDRPSRRGAAVSGPLDEVVMRALERDPGARFASAIEMGRALDDAEPRARQSEVAQWVAGVVGDLQERRRAEVSAIESDATIVKPIVLPFPVRATRATPEPPRPLGRRLFWVGACALAIAAIAFAVPTLARRAAAVDPIAASPEAPSAHDDESPDPKAADPVDPPSTPSGAPVTRRPRPRTPRPPSPGSARRPGCSPAYFVDSAGHVVWKRECF